MMLEIEKYVSKPRYVDVVQVSEENIDEVAEWCSGEVRSMKVSDTQPDSKYIKVRVYNPRDDRQTRAHIGDWILYSGTGYQVFITKSFRKNFEKADPKFSDHVPPWTQEQADAAKARFEDATKRAKEKLNSAVGMMTTNINTTVASAGDIVLSEIKDDPEEGDINEQV